MSDFDRTGNVYENVPDRGVGRHAGPNHQSALIDSLHKGQQVIVLCYSIDETVTWTTPPFSGHPHGQENTSPAWDFVVTGDHDTGGFVPDVYIYTDADIRQQLGDQGTCGALRNRLPDDLPPL